MSHAVHWENIRHLKKEDEVKFVIADRSDYDWSKEVLGRYPLLLERTILFSPAFGLMEPRQLAEWVLEDRLPVRLQLQIHKYIWDPQMRGV